jgi:hypothetical protein
MNCKCIREIHVRENRRATIRNGESRDTVYIRHQARKNEDKQSKKTPPPTMKTEKMNKTDHIKKEDINK